MGKRKRNKASPLKPSLGEEEEEEEEVVKKGKKKKKKQVYPVQKKNEKKSPTPSSLAKLCFAFADPN